MTDDTTTGPVQLPDTARLLRGIQSTLQRLATQVEDEQARWELATVDIVLSELARRNEHAFYAGYYGDLRELLVEGLEWPGGNIDAAARDAMAHELATSLGATVRDDAGYDILMPLANRLLVHLATLVEATHEEGHPELRDYLQRVVAKESEFHVHRTLYAQGRKWDTAPRADTITAEKLEAYLREREPERAGLRITRFRQLVGGFQKVTVLFETADDCGRSESLVLRSEKKDRFVQLDAGDIRREYEIVKFLEGEGVPVATPLWLEEDASKLGNRFLVSTRVPGGNVGSAVATGAITDEIARSHIEAIAKVHRIPVDARMRNLPIGRWAEFPNAQENIRASVRYWRNQIYMKHANPSPITERLTRWLIDNAPGGDIPQCLVHCDFGPHNTLVHEGRLSGILDWESSRIGDPAEDVSWFLMSCGGQVDYGKAIRWYEECTGHRISEFRLRYYDVKGCLKIMVSNSSAEAMYAEQEDASIVWLNLAYIFAPYGTSTTEERIRVAEAARRA